MNKYDAIMVPADEKTTSPEFIAGGMWRFEKDCIVLTIEEALEMWNFASKRSEEITNNIAAGKEPRDTIYPSFKSYLTSKGITL